MAADKSPKKSDDKPKKLTPYNSFMKTELAKVKKAHPNLSHKEAFKAAAGNVSTTTTLTNYHHIIITTLLMKWEWCPLLFIIHLYMSFRIFLSSLLQRFISSILKK